MINIEKKIIFGFSLSLRISQKIILRLKDYKLGTGNKVSCHKKGENNFLKFLKK